MKIFENIGKQKTGNYRKFCLCAFGWLGPGWSLIVRFRLCSLAETGSVGSWLELDLPDHRPSHVVAPPPEAGSWSRACGASKDF